MYLRKTRGREPTHGEVSKITQNNERLKTAKSALTWADIAAAYERGEEVRISLTLARAAA